MTFNVLSNQIVQLLAVSSLKISAILLAALILVRLLPRSSAALRHWVLNLTLIATLILPLLSIISPVWSLAILPDAAPASGGVIDHTIAFFAPFNISVAADPKTNSEPSVSKLLNDGKIRAADQQPVQAAAPVSVPNNHKANGDSAAGIILLIWLIGASLLLSRWFAQFRRVLTTTRRSFPADAAWIALLEDQARLLQIRRHVRLIFSAEITIPMTWGLLHPIIVLPLDAESWDQARRRGVVLRHELAHILRRDYLTQWILLIACTLNWFNPLIWKVTQRMTLEREQASDDLVLNTGVRGIEYAAHLLAIARSALTQRPFQMVGLAMAQRSDLEQRIRGVLNKRQRRSTSRRLRLLFLIAAAAALLPLGGLRLSSVNAQSNPVRLTLAVDSGLAEGLNDQGLLKDFLNAHPGVTINLVDIQDIGDAAGHVDDFFTGLQKYASSADVLSFSGYDLALSPLATRAGYILDLAPLVQSDSEVLQDDFYPQLWTSYQWDGGIWGLPIGADMALLVYDKSAFDNARLTYPDGSWTLDQFVSAGERLNGQGRQRQHRQRRLCQQRAHLPRSLLAQPVHQRRGRCQHDPQRAAVQPTGHQRRA